MSYFKCFASILLLIGVAGCTTQIQTAQNQDAIESSFTYAEIDDPNPVGFEGYLQRDYKALALFQAEEMKSSRTATHFAQKSRDAGQGYQVQPDPVVNVKLPEGKEAELKDAETQMKQLFASGAREVSPETAATMQVSYDCWLWQQEVNIQPQYIQYCKDRFAEAATLSYANIETAAGEPAEPLVATFYFLFDSDELIPGDERRLQNLQPALRKSPQITVIGYADTLGRESYNQALSEQRAQAVRDILYRKLEIPSEKIEVKGKGQRELEIPTGDGQSERRNRRVVITY